MVAILTLPQAGELLGVNDSDLSRLIRIGALPEARKVDRPEGRVWTISEEHLPAIASRNGWSIDLRDGADNALSIEKPSIEIPSAEKPGNEKPGNEKPIAEKSGIEKPIAAKNGASKPQFFQPVSAQVGSLGEPVEPFDVALVPHKDSMPEAAGQQADSSLVEVELSEGSDLEPAENSERPETTDLALLDRLLESHENRVAAQIREQEARMALSTLADNHNKATGELDIERRERMAVAERYREERRARAVADAKVAELRDRVAREMALAEAEKEARTEALNRGLRAERDAANAVALLGWRARRRYRKLSEAKQ